jgi:hypothetical protein
MVTRKLIFSAMTLKVIIGPNFQTVMENSRKILVNSRLVGVDTMDHTHSMLTLMEMERKTWYVTIQKDNIGQFLQLLED